MTGHCEKQSDQFHISRLEHRVTTQTTHWEYFCPFKGKEHSKTGETVSVTYLLF